MIIRACPTPIVDIFQGLSLKNTTDFFKPYAKREKTHQKVSLKHKFHSLLRFIFNLKCHARVVF